MSDETFRMYRADNMPTESDGVDMATVMRVAGKMQELLRGVLLGLVEVYGTTLGCRMYFSVLTTLHMNEMAMFAPTYEWFHTHLQQMLDGDMDTWIACGRDAPKPPPGTLLN